MFSLVPNNDATVAGNPRRSTARSVGFRALRGKYCLGRSAAQQDLRVPPRLRNDDATWVMLGAKQFQRRSISGHVTPRPSGDTWSIILPCQLARCAFQPRVRSWRARRQTIGLDQIGELQTFRSHHGMFHGFGQHIVVPRGGSGHLKCPRRRYSVYDAYGPLDWHVALPR